MNAFPSGRPRRRSTVTLNVEALERRDVPIITTVSGNLLQVSTVGDPIPHTIGLVDNGTNTNGNLTVFLDGIANPGLTASNHITAMQIFGGSANLIVIYIQGGNLVSGESRTLQEFLGSGVNTTLVRLDGTTLSGNVSISAVGSTGQDFFYVSALNTTINSGAQFQMAVTGNQDQTIFHELYNGIDLGALGVLVTAGSRNKTLEFADIIPEATSNGFVFAQEIGSPKNDFQELLINSSGSSPAIFSFVDGGGGNANEAVVTPGIPVVNIQKGVLVI